VVTGLSNDIGAVEEVDAHPVKATTATTNIQAKESVFTVFRPTIELRHDRERSSRSLSVVAGSALSSFEEKVGNEGNRTNKRKCERGQLRAGHS
jgi:hypothetical protein